MYITLLCVGRSRKNTGRPPSTNTQSASPNITSSRSSPSPMKRSRSGKRQSHLRPQGQRSRAPRQAHQRRHFVITLEIGGKELDTLALADTFRRWEMSGHTHSLRHRRQLRPRRAHPPAQRFCPFLFQAHLSPPAHARHFLRAALPLRPRERWTEIS